MTLNLYAVYPYVIAIVMVAGLALGARRVAVWRGLASRFPHAGAPPAGTATFENGTACGISFRGLLSVGADASGLYVAPSLPPLRALFPAIGVPWDAVQVEGEYRAVFAMVRYRLGGPSGSTLVLFKAGRLQQTVAPWVAANVRPAS